MCGIAGLVSLRRRRIADLGRRLQAMSALIAHRGPDGEASWIEEQGLCGLAHRRLAIIDLSPQSAQPMKAPNGAVIIHNGEIYNHVELREQLKSHWQFRTASDTETILAAHERFGEDCVNHLRGMFAFVIWKDGTLFVARDRF